MSLITRGPFVRGWCPDADASSGPVDGLLRADNLVLDEGVPKLRRGTAAIGTTLGASVNSLYTVALNGTRYRCAGAGNGVFVNGVSKNATIDGTGDVRFGSAMGQIFWTRGDDHQKFDGTTVRNWGLAMTGGAPTVAATTQRGLTLSSFDSGESPAWTVSEGSGSFVADRYGVASNALKVQGDATSGRGTFAKTFSVAFDTSTIEGVAASDDDLLQFYANVPDPGGLSKVILVIDVGDGSFAKDTYRTVFPQFAAQGAVDFGDSYDVVGRDRDRLSAEKRSDRLDRGSLDPAEYQGVQSWSDAVVPPGDAVIGWQQWSVRRGDLLRRGSTPGATWATIKAVKLVAYYTTATAANAISFDQLEFVGGADQPLNGTYRHRYIYVRSDGTYVSPSAPSAYSEETSFSAGAANVTCPADASRDSQATAIWVYRMGEGLDNWYRTGTADLTASTQEATGFGQSGGEDVDQLLLEGMTPALGYASYTCAAEATFAAAHSLTLVGPANFTCPAEGADGYLEDCGAAETFTVTGSWLGAVVVHDTTSDRDALIANLTLDLNVTVPPDDIIGIAGPHYDRLWLLTADSLYPSRRLNPDGYATTQVLRIAGENETPLWIAGALQALWVGTTRDIYRVDGTGAENPDGTFDVTVRGMNIDHPPISEAVAVEGNSLIYLAADGWRALSGLGSVSLSGQTSLLYRGLTRSGVSAVNLTTGRLRACVGLGQLIAITPEGASTTSSTVLYRAVLDGAAKGQWYRHVYPSGLTAITREPDGTVLIGDSTGLIRQVDTGTQDTSSDIAVTLWTMADDFGLPFSEKTPADLRLKMDTGGSTASLALHVDGATTAALTKTVAQDGILATPLDVRTLGEFTRLQLRLTVTTDAFALYTLGLQAIPKPAGVRVWDSGPIDLGVADLIWLRTVKVKCYAEEDLTVTPYFDDVEFPAVTIPVSAVSTSTWEASLGRGYKGRVPRVVITSTRPFFPYWLQFTRRNTLAQSDKPLAQIACGL